MHLDGIARFEFTNRRFLQPTVREHLPDLAVFHRQHLLDGRPRALDGVGRHQFREVRQRQNHQGGMRRTEQQTCDNRRNRQEIGVRAHIAAQTRRRAPCHRHRQSQTGQRFQRREACHRTAEQAAGQNRVTEHHRTRVECQSLCQLLCRHGHFRLFRLAACLTIAVGVHGIARHRHVHAFTENLRIRRGRIEAQEDAAGNRRHLHALHTRQVGKHLGNFFLLVIQEVQPFYSEPQPPAKAMRHLTLHPVFLCFPIEHVIPSLIWQFRFNDSCFFASIAQTLAVKRLN